MSRTRGQRSAAGDPAAGPLPHLNTRSPSTRLASDDVTLGSGRKAQRGTWRIAPPLPGFRLWGRRASVRIEVTPRIGSDLWLEVSYAHGTVWIHHDASVADLVFKLQEGGFKVRPPKTK